MSEIGLTYADLDEVILRQQEGGIAECEYALSCKREYIQQTQNEVRELEDRLAILKGYLARLREYMGRQNAETV